jgi:hypothetical protein
MTRGGKRKEKRMRRLLDAIKRFVGGGDSPERFDVGSPERRRMLIDYQRRDYYND